MIQICSKFYCWFLKLLSTYPIHIVVWGNFPFNESFITSLGVPFTDLPKSTITLLQPRTGYVGCIILWNLKVSGQIEFKGQPYNPCLRLIVINLSVAIWISWSLITFPFQELVFVFKLMQKCMHVCNCFQNSSHHIHEWNIMHNKGLVAQTNYRRACLKINLKSYGSKIPLTVSFQILYFYQGSQIVFSSIWYCV